LRVFGEVPDTDYCTTAPVDFFLKVSVPLPFAAFGAENQIDMRVGLKIRAQEVSNIKWRYLGESAPYVPVSRRNIGLRDASFGHQISDIIRFGPWTENPRVGGSIPPLAILNQILIFCRNGSMSNTVGGEQ